MSEAKDNLKQQLKELDDKVESAMTGSMLDDFRLEALEALETVLSSDDKESAKVSIEDILIVTRAIRDLMAVKCFPLAHRIYVATRQFYDDVEQLTEQDE